MLEAKLNSQHSAKNSQKVTFPTQKVPVDNADKCTTLALRNTVTQFSAVSKTSLRKKGQLHLLKDKITARFNILLVFHGVFECSTLPMFSSFRTVRYLQQILRLIKQFS